MIAAERTGRRARLLELDPGYVDVVVNRWQTHTGRDATLSGNCQTFTEVIAQRANVGTKL